jgi:MFS transporter, NNP family, nitrate/nitrite transporter
MTEHNASKGNSIQLILATGAFAICFAVFGSVSAMMPIIKKTLGLTPVQVSVALAVPVLLGSLGRIPLGVFTDRHGGRLIFTLVMATSIVPAFLIGEVSAYWQLLTCGFFIGIALASFSVGVAMVSGWFPPERQGFALGVYGAGNIGQSLAAFGSPLLAARLGFAWGFLFFGVLLAIWLVVFWLAARNAPRRAPAKSFGDMLKPLSEKMSWVLSFYYFLTFGGFVAMSVYLPTFLTEMFRLTPQDAGLRTAGFVLLATALRPVGGALVDKVGGRTILAAAIGLGNGAVFKLVPEYFPNSVGAVTGLVGAAGGLGGFFPPLLVGGIKQMTGAFTWGFVLLCGCAVICELVTMTATANRPSQLKEQAI